MRFFLAQVERKPDWPKSNWPNTNWPKSNGPNSNKPVGLSRIVLSRALELSHSLLLECGRHVSGVSDIIFSCQLLRWETHVGS